MRPPDIEAFREMLSDDRLHLAIGTIAKLELATDRSVLRVRVNIFPEQLEMVCRMTWDHTGPDAGIFGFPVIDDLVMVGFVDGHEDEAFVLKRLTSKVDKIPLQAVSGDSVIRALGGKKSHLLSDTTILLGRGGSDPAQPLVLGTVFKTAYSLHLAESSKQADESSKHMHIGNMGYLTTVPDNAAAFTAVKGAVDAIKANPVDNSDMVSDLSFTEK